MSTKGFPKYNCFELIINVALSLVDRSLAEREDLVQGDSQLQKYLVVVASDHYAVIL